MLWQKVHVHHIRVGEVLDLIDAGDVGHECTGAHVDEDPFGFQEIPVDPHLIGTFEAAVSPVERHVFQAFHPVRHPAVRLPDHFVLPRLDTFHVHFDRAVDDHAELCAPSGNIGGPSAGHQRLGRNTADVHTGAAVEMTLEYGYPQPFTVQAVGKGGPGLSGANHNRVIFGCHSSHLSR